ncbi:hypothetical protein QR680_004082 [Steinernema hermaphroditum]|uniref:Uncharacterized protein n=1 Tax=Steinernema hermaphroditum TaxID=289476 RepID=A0AA39LSN1_9BILA|nr:hypothetical protein QR680_004082 [Steinernema hermaphroditum]
MCCDSDGERCCCGCMHVKTGTLLIALLIIGFNGFSLVKHVKYASTEDIYGRALWSAERLLNFSVAVLAIIAVRTESPKLLLPLMIRLLIYLALMLCAAVITTLGLQLPELIEYLQKSRMLSDEQIRREKKPAMAVTIYVLSVLFQAWFFNTVYWCYEYLKSLQYHPPRLVAVQMQMV